MGWRRRLLGAAGTLLVAACRIGFEPIGGSADASLDGSPDGPRLDGAPAGTPRTFGERSTCDVRGITSDTTLKDEAPVFNYGRNEYLDVTESGDDIEHALVRFDVSSVAPGTVVVDAEVTFFVEETSDEIFGPLAVRRVRSDWAEGVSDGDTASGATWQRADVGVPWTTAGGDTDAMVLASAEPATLDAPITFAIGAAVAQEWVNAPASNQGLLVGNVPGSPDEVHFHFRSRENTARDTAPVLTLYLRE